MKRLNIIGCGNVGKTLAALFKGAGVFSIGSILNRSIDSAKEACEFLKDGDPVSAYKELKSADIFMLAVPDDAIEQCESELAKSGRVLPTSIVFHCSGAYSAAKLSSVSKLGAMVGSLHVVRSVSDPLEVIKSFPGTFCALEGDDRFIEEMEAGLKRIKAKTFRLKGSEKLTYHAATVFGSNYLTTILWIAKKLLEQNSVPPEALWPLVEGCIEKIKRVGPESALTGPLARGDSELVARQVEELKKIDPKISSIYTALGMATLDLVETSGQLSSDKKKELTKSLSKL